MMETLIDPTFWVALFSLTLVQIALGADNLIIITIIANKLPGAERAKAIRWGLILAMLFRILLLSILTWVLTYATTVFHHLDVELPGIRLHGELTLKALVLLFGGLFLVWKGIKELRHKAKGAAQEVRQASRFKQVVALIVGINLLFSIDSILTVVGMTDIFAVMVGSVVISVALMLAFARFISDYISRNPDFEILGLFVLLLIGFVLFLEGGHAAELTVNDGPFPYIPQWIVIFMLMLMFSVDLYQNWLGRRRDQEEPIRLHRRRK